MPSRKEPYPIDTEFLSELRDNPTTPKDSWYFIAAATLTVLNRPDDVALVLSHAIANTTDAKEQLRVTRRIREALIKSAGIGGLPKTIRALLVLKRHTPPYLLDDAKMPTSRSRDFLETPVEEVFARGQAFFSTVYGPNSHKLMHVMNASGTPDLGAAGRLMYAFFLSHTDILSAKETMFVTVSGAIVSDVQDVVLNHMRGAVNHGASVEEVRGVRDIVIKICERVWSRTGNSGWEGSVAKL